MARDTPRSSVQWVILAIASLRADYNIVNPLSIRMAIRENAIQSGTKYEPRREEADIQEAIDSLRLKGLIIMKGEALDGDVDDTLHFTERGVHVWGKLANIRPLELGIQCSLRARKVPAIRSSRQQEQLFRLHSDQLRRFSDLVQLEEFAKSDSDTVPDPLTDLQDMTALRSEIALLRSKSAGYMAVVASLNARVAELEAAIDWSNQEAERKEATRQFLSLAFR